MNHETSSAETMAPGAAEPSLSLGRVLKVVTPIVVVLVGLALFLMSQLPSSATEQMHENLLDALLADREAQIEGIKFVDADGDMVADPPADDQEAAKIWQPLIDAIAEKTGIPTELAPYSTPGEQLEAMRDGKLHITLLNTGAVPRAVLLAGFVPVSTYGDDNGGFGYTMKLITAAGSPIQKLDQLKPQGKKKFKVEFVSPDSNSGFKAPVVLLLNDFKLLPERDYEYAFSMGHKASVDEVIAGRAAIAPVASDLLDQMLDKGEVKSEAIRTVYESERFPPAALGYVYNLAPAIRTALDDILLNYVWTGTPLAEKQAPSGNTKFVAVDYKDDWANIRRIDETISRERKGK